MPPRNRPRPRALVAAAEPHAQRWLLFVHQLPASPSNLRVRTWRRLQQLGAVAVKLAMYVLPDSPNAREDVEWLKTDIKSAGGSVPGRRFQRTHEAALSRNVMPPSNSTWRPN